MKTFQTKLDPKGKKGDVLKKEKKEYVVDPRNKLNELNGKDWIKFLKSWFIFDALQKDLKEERTITKDCDQHPATFSPTMISDFILFFTKSNMNVLDPFCGIGSTLVACDRTNRNGFGIDINEMYVEITKKRISKKQKAYLYDSLKIEDLNLPKIDLCITSPPYWAMLNKIDVNQRMRMEQGLDIKYSDNPYDLGNILDYQEFLVKLKNIFIKIYNILRDKAYLVIIIQNVIDGGFMVPLAWDLARILTDPYVLKKEKIWCQDHKQLHPYGYPYAWVSNTFHHYCLVFRKEEKFNKAIFEKYKWMKSKI